MDGNCWVSFNSIFRYKILNFGKKLSQEIERLLLLILPPFEFLRISKRYIQKSKFDLFAIKPKSKNDSMVFRTTHPFHRTAPTTTATTPAPLASTSLLAETSAYFHKCFHSHT